jgi:hypothetical protein
MCKTKRGLFTLQKNSIFRSFFNVFLSCLKLNFCQLDEILIHPRYSIYRTRCNCVIYITPLITFSYNNFTYSFVIELKNFSRYCSTRATSNACFIYIRDCYVCFSQCFYLILCYYCHINILKIIWLIISVKTKNQARKPDSLYDI